MFHLISETPFKLLWSELHSHYTCLFSDEETHMDVHDRALLYYRLLKTNPKEVRVFVYIGYIMYLLDFHSSRQQKPDTCVCFVLL